MPGEKHKWESWSSLLEISDSQLPALPMDCFSKMGRRPPPPLTSPGNHEDGVGGYRHLAWSWPRANPFMDPPKVLLSMVSMEPHQPVKGQESSGHVNITYIDHKVNLTGARQLAAAVLLFLKTVLVMDSLRLPSWEFDHWTY